MADSDLAANASSSSNNDGLTPAQRLLAKHEAAEYHKATVEEVVDEDDKAPAASVSQAAANSATNGSIVEEPGDGEMSEVAKGKQKMPQAPIKSTGLDTQSEELFPALGGGPKPRTPAVAGPGAWGNRKLNAGLKPPPNGLSNGANSISSPISSGTSTPVSGIRTPSSPNIATGQRRPGPNISLPGVHTDEFKLYHSQMDKSKQIKPLLDEIKRKSRVNITTREDATSVTFVGSGPRDAVAPALQRVANELGAKQKVKVDVPASLRSHIIGRGGAKVQEIMRKTGAKIQIPKSEKGTETMEDDDSVVQVEIEGDPMATEFARREILNIVGERTTSTNLRLKDIPPEFFPFLAGPHNSRVNEMERDKDIRITIPSYHTWHHQPPPRVNHADERPNFVPHPDMHIQISGDRVAAQQAKQRIERHAEYLRQQLMLKEQSFQRGQHQFIVGERGMSPHDFLQETGCVVVLPPSHDDTEDITIIGPPEKINEGLERANTLAAELLSTSIDPRKNILNAPHGPDAHARALAQYLRSRQLEENFQSLYNAHIAFPVSADTSGSWDIFARDKKSLPNARSDLTNIIRAHPPSRLTLVEVDRFFHPHLQQRCGQSLKNDFGVHMIVPHENESNQVVLVYEGPTDEHIAYQIPRQRPSEDEIAAFELALHQARNQILSIIGDQQDILTKEVVIPQKFDEKVRKYISREQQQAQHPSSFPVQVVFGDDISRPSMQSGSVSRGGASLRGPGAHVTDLEAKILVFLEQAERDELERGYTTTFDFPAKFNNQLIGKRGSKINALRDLYDVDIKTIEGGKIEIKGPKAKAEQCKAEILAMGKKWEDETTESLKIDPKFHRDLIGKRGEDVNKLQRSYNVRIQFPRSNIISDDQSVADTASEAGGSRYTRSNQAPDEVVIRGPRKGVAAAKGELEALYKHYKENSYTGTVSVAKKQIPSLMGRGGIEMDRLRADTKAQIDVPNGQDASDSDSRVEIKLKGSKQAVEAAKAELQKLSKAFDDIVTRTIDVDKKYHQTLIGSNGSNIRRIVLEAGGPENSAKAVKFPSRESASSTIHVEGAEAMVSKIIAAIENFVSQKENEVIDSVDVPADKHRNLIGAGGQKKRDLERQLNVSLDVPKQGSGRTAVKITGASQDVAKAKEHIAQMFKAQEAVTVLVPKSLHHTVAQNGNIFRRLRSDHKVTVDHGGKKPPPRTESESSRRRTNGAAPPLITDEPNGEEFSWTVEVSRSPEVDAETIPWILSGPSAEDVAAAKAHVESALEAASKPITTGYLRLSDPKDHRYVVGPKGRHINDVRNKTGCTVQLPAKDSNGDGEEAIVIVGDAKGCEDAKTMILDYVREGQSQR